MSESLVVRADQLEQDRFIQARCARFIGSVSIEQEVTIEPVTDPYACKSFLEATHHAAEGNETALLNVAANARTAATEAIYKAGHITHVETEFSDDGSRAQHGQSMMDTHANGLRFSADTPALKARGEAETLNGFRIEDLHRSGLLEDHWLVVPSFYPDDMTDKEAEKAGFFVNSKTSIFQATTVQNGVCLTESAFVAGVTEKDAPRHDITAGKRLYEAYGVEAPQTATEFITSPLLIPKRLMPSGIFDVVRAFDGHIGGTFFGQKVPPQDYDDFMAMCRQREADLETVTSNVVHDLLASRHSLQTPLDAVKKLYELVRREVIEQAGRDHTIDASVFGGAAEFFVNQARYFNDIGDNEQAKQAINEAEQYAQVGMCGIGGSCGLEDVMLYGAMGGELKKRLKAESGDTILKDTERACKCGKKEIVYAFNKNKVNKLCHGCGAFESRVSKAA